MSFILWILQVDTIDSNVKEYFFNIKFRKNWCYKQIEQLLFLYIVYGVSVNVLSQNFQACFSNEIWVIRVI